jgi:multidrug efflux pump subunit AcrB
MAGSRRHVGLLHDRRARGRADRAAAAAARGSGASTRSAPCAALGGAPVAVGELTARDAHAEDASIYHKNLQPVTYVTGDLAGADESPVYAILQMNEAIAELTLPEGYAFEIFNALAAVRHARSTR